VATRPQAGFVQLGQLGLDSGTQRLDQLAFAAELRRADLAGNLTLSAKLS